MCSLTLEQLPKLVGLLHNSTFGSFVEWVIGLCWNCGGGFAVGLGVSTEKLVALRAVGTELNAGGKRERFAVSAECYFSFLTNKNHLWEKVINAHGKKFQTAQGCRVQRKSPPIPPILPRKLQLPAYLTERSLCQWFLACHDFVHSFPWDTG